MKNPLKTAGEKIKNFTRKFRKHPGETPKMVVDGIGDSSIVGGLTLIGTAAFMSASPSVMLIAGGAFILAGAGAKFAASKMKPQGFDVTAPQKPAAPSTGAPAHWRKKISAPFKRAQTAKSPGPQGAAPAPAAPKLD
ncbi:MAG TPA: hypothetical protein VEF76_06130 [Patescibacteria group bacterium]|nr:hypothetical protein [Patescibacteria group bacterium]